MRKLIFYGVTLLLLCQCASKHQPIALAPYFPLRPTSYFSTEYVFEMRRLEGLAQLNVFEKKRLAELYQIELKTLKKDSPRIAEVTARLNPLKEDAASQDGELQQVRQEMEKAPDLSPSEDKGPVELQKPVLKKAFQTAYRLWNRDENDGALKTIRAITASEALRESTSKPEWLKILNLQLRIALDKGDLTPAGETYHQMKDYDACAAETTQAALLLALRTFSAGDAKGALQIFEAQCDSDKSPSNRIKHEYWRARFKESETTDLKTLYAEVLRFPLAGYYYDLAKIRTGEKIIFPEGAYGKPAYLSREMALPGSVNHLLLRAEERLAANLKKDASVFLLKAAHLLKKDATPEHLIGLLYTAHLMQAAGYSLSAMKVYSLITSWWLEKPEISGATQLDFLGEMFPRPHSAAVESLARQWNLDPDFIYALMRQESAFNPAALSGANARGLMQIMPQLAKSLSQLWSYQPYYADRILFHAEENLKLSVFHLHQLQALVPHLALMAASYNAGLSRVSGWWKRNGTLPLDIFVELIPVNETRNYVKLVLRNYYHYKAQRNGGSVDPSVVPFQLPAYGALKASAS